MTRATTTLLIAVLALVLMGILIIYSTSSIDGSISKSLKHLLYVIMGISAGFVASRFDYHRLRDPGIFRGLVLFALALLCLVLIPGIGVKVYGARRWLELAGFRFQPSEFAKFALILLLAVKLSENQDNVKSFRYGVAPAVAIAVFFAGLVVLEKDLGTPVILMTMALGMILMAGARLYHIGLSAAAVAAAAYALIRFDPERYSRLLIFRDPWQDPTGDGLHPIQSLMGFARGGVWGVGPGAGQQKLGNLFGAHTDFVFSAWGEEMGLVGTLAAVAIFAIVLMAAFRIATCAPDLFGALLAAGIASLIGIQAALNMAVSTCLVPTKGLPLPFMSYGGSSLIISLTLVGILLNIGLQAQQPEGNKKFLPA